jgi:hypothetical protein
MDLESVTATAAIYGGSGQFWFDDLKIEEVPTSVPTTDDRHLKVNGSNSHEFSVAPDPTLVRNGHPTPCIMLAQSADATDWESYGAVDRVPAEQFLGKRVRVSAWVKTKDMTSPMGIYIRARGPNDSNMADADPKSRKMVESEDGWKHLFIEINVPPGAMNLSYGIFFRGRGKIWVDDFKTEVVGDGDQL